MRIFILAFLGLFSFDIFAQSDSTSNIVPPNELELLFSYYHQEGDHAAVTGGKGDEALHVESTRIVYKVKNEKDQWSFKMGTDVITSASTDKIDYVISSASYIDMRTSVDVGYAVHDSLNSFGGGLGTSIESDYWSRNLQINYQRKLSEFSKIGFVFQFFWDDLRWGWINQYLYKGTRLVYPVELRGTQWFDINNRNTYSLKTSFETALNKRLKLGVVNDLVFQNGVLSTPFHRVYFNGVEQAKIESFPSVRFKVPLGAQLNYFLGGHSILKNTVRFYWDSFNLRSYTHQFTWIEKITARFRVGLFYRFYVQNGVDFWRSYGTHEVGANYYTSDYDLSAFSSSAFGFLIKYKLKKLKIESLTERYFRSDGLSYFQSSIGLKWELK